MSFSVGELLGTLRITGATQAADDILRVQQSMNLTADSTEKLGASVGQTETALAGAGRQADVASSGTAKLRAAQLSAIAAQERYNAVLADENASLGRKASAEASVIRSQSAVAKASLDTAAAVKTEAVATEEAAASTRTFGASVESSIATLGKLGIALGAFELASKALELVKGGSAFQQEMLLIQTQAGATSTEVKNMSAGILAMAGSVATAPEALATSMYHVESVGLREADALNAVTIAAEGAKVGHADLEQTTNALTAAVASGISGVQNMSQAMGALNATVGAGDMSMSDLNDAMGSGILIVSKQFGLSLTDVGAALATFGDNNIRGANAATMLRVAITSMAKPVAGGSAELGKLGMTSKQLATDMQTGGLNKALVDLSTHLTAAGVTGDQVGAVLTTAFGKKAGPGISVLIDQLSRFQTKTAEIDTAAGNFGAAWIATTKTTGFAFEQLGAQLQSAGIQVFNKVGPAAADVAIWLGTKVPEATKELVKALTPLEHELAFVLVPAWHGLVDVLTVAEKTLADIGHVLSTHSAAVTVVGTVVLGMWAAWKGYQIVTAAATAIGKAMDTIASRAAFARAQLATVATGASATSYEAYSARVAAAAKLQEAQVATASAAQTAAVDTAAAEQAAAYTATARAAAAAAASTDSVLAEGAAASLASAQVTEAAAAAKASASQAAAAKMIAAETEASAAVEAASAAEATAATGMSLATGLAMGTVGVVLGIAAFAWNAHEKSVQANKTAINDYAVAIEQDNGALGVNSRLVAENALEQDGAYAAALKLGIGQKDLTDAALGNADSLAIVNAALDLNKAKIAGLNDTQSSTAVKTAGLGGSISTVTSAIGENNKQITAAVQKAKDLAAANGESTAAIGLNTGAIDANTTSTDGNASSTATETTVINGVTVAMTGSTSAADALSQALDLLSGNSITAQQAQLNFEDGLAGLAAQITANAQANKDNAKSLDDSTVSGRKNEEWVLAQISLANDTANAQAKNGDTIDQVTAKLATNTAEIKKAAVAAGLSAKQVQALIDQYAATPADVKTLVSADTASASSNIAGVQKQLNTYTASKPNPLVGADTSSATNKWGSLQALLNRYGASKPDPLISANTSGAVAKISAIQGLLDALTNHSYTATVNTVQGTVGGLTTLPGVQGHAAGGLIRGAGSRTSDSILAMLSDQEFVSTADSADRNLGALEAGNRGAKLVAVAGSYAAGGLVGIQHYASGGTVSAAEAASKAATAAANAAKLRLTTQTTFDYTDLPNFIKALTGTTAALTNAGKTLVAQIASAVNAHQVSAGLLTSIQADNAQLDKLATTRDGIAKQLTAANTALTAAQKLFTDEQTSVAAQIDTFDITTAGQTATTTGTSTSLNGIMSQLKSQVTSAAQFGQEIAKLKAEGVNSALLQQIAAAGPESGSANTINALLGATPAQIKQLNALQGQLVSTSNSVGTSVATSLYGAGVSAAQGLVAGLTSQESAVTAAMKKMADAMVAEIKSQLDIHSPSRVTRALGQFTSTGFALGLADGIPAAAMHSRSLAAAAASGMGSLASSAGIGSPAASQVQYSYTTPAAQPGLDGVRSDLAKISGRFDDLADRFDKSLTAQTRAQHTFTRQGGARS